MDITEIKDMIFESLRKFHYWNLKETKSIGRALFFAIEDKKGDILCTIWDKLPPVEPENHIGTMLIKWERTLFPYDPETLLTMALKTMEIKSLFNNLKRLEPYVDFLLPGCPENLEIKVNTESAVFKRAELAAVITEDQKLAYIAAASYLKRNSSGPYVSPL